MYIACVESVIKIWCIYVHRFPNNIARLCTVLYWFVNLINIEDCLFNCINDSIHLSDSRRIQLPKSVFRLLSRLFLQVTYFSELLTRGISMYLAHLFKEIIRHVFTFKCGFLKRFSIYVIMLLVTLKSHLHHQCLLFSYCTWHFNPTKYYFCLWIFLDIHSDSPSLYCTWRGAVFVITHSTPPMSSTNHLNPCR